MVVIQRRIFSFIRFWISVTAVAVCGCGSSVSPLARLDQEFPVEQDRYAVVECTINEVACDSTGPLKTTASEKTELRGKLQSKKSKTSSIGQGWKYTSEEIDQGEQQRHPPMSHKPGEPSYMLALYVHGDNPQVKQGIVAWEMVHSRTSKKGGDELDFRAHFSVPQRGTYVMDLVTIDNDAEPPAPGSSRPAGIPIHRWELVVK